MRLILLHQIQDISSSEAYTLPINYESKEKFIIDLKNDYCMWIKNNHHLLKELFLAQKEFSSSFFENEIKDTQEELIKRLEDISDKISKHYFLNIKPLNIYFFITDYNLIKFLEEHIASSSDTIIEELLKFYNSPIVLTVDEFFADVD